jgi:hypothetical protein
MKIPCPNPKCPYGKDGMCIRIPCVYEPKEGEKNEEIYKAHVPKLR